MHKGFTLIQLSILLVVASLVLVAILPSSRTNLNANNDSAARLNGILQALREYEATNARLPCPADATQPIGSSTYGQAAAGAGTTTNCTGGTPRANYVDATNNIAIGMVPVHTLGLSNDYALDGYGRDFTYAVDTNATSCFSGTLPGKITVTDNGTPISTVVALVSHGADGHGAFIPVTGSSGAAVRLNAGSTDTDQLTNAHVNSSFAPVTPLTNFVRKQPTPTFDDLVTYKSLLWNINNAPLASAPLLPSIVPPANGTYFTGQSLTFSVTYGSAVSVTGSPRLTLSIPQSSGGTATHYASYASSSGNTATFTYAVQSTDYAPTAPSGVSVSSPINLNGGAILVAGASACLSFTPPSLNSILLNPLTIYISDTGNNRVQYFNGSGVYQGQFGSAGTGNGQFSMGTFSYLALDASNNLWVGDPGNLRMQQFNSTGTYGNQVGGSWGFGYAYGIATDASSNVWVVHGTSTLGEYNSSGSSLQQFTLAFNPQGGDAVDAGGNIWLADYHDGNTYYEYANSGIQTAAFTPTGAAKATYPYGMAVDGGGNIWVADGSNIKRYNSSGAFIAEAGCGGAEGECATNSAPGTFGGIIGQIAIDASGNVWAPDNANNRVEEFDNCGNFLFQFGASGSSNGLFNGPFGIAVTGKPGGGGACITAVNPPASGTYSTGQALTFTVSYNQAVTVTGTPQLVLTIGSNTRYANYVSGNGTTTLTFSYTIQSSDTATGIAIASSINLNGGSISSSGTSANLSFTPPSMGGILINSSAVMVIADNGNSRIEELSLAGTYLGQFNDSAAGNSSYDHLYYASVDGSGNLWASTNNNVMEKFSAAGVYQNLQFGGGGGGNGNLNRPWGSAVDSSGNIWVADSYNHRVQEFSSTGSWIRTIGGTGACGASEFKDPQYLHFDSGGNLFVSDTTCGVIQKFSSSGSYIATLGPAIPNDTTSFSTDVNDLAFDTCGNMWIEDEGNKFLTQLDYEGNFLQNVSFSGGAQSITIDSSGNIYVLDESSNVVNVYNSSGTLTGTLSSAGSGNGQISSSTGITLIGSAPSRRALTSCPAVILAAAGPASINYSTGNTLGFAITYDQAVTVTGTPEIRLGIGSNTRYATYVGGSGTSTLTFSYTVTPSDYTNTGVAEASTITLNGGTITNGSNTAGRNFTAPSFSGITVNVPSPFSYARTITIDHTKVPNTNQTNFPALVSGTYAYLATQANGGNIQNTVSLNGQTVPADLEFTSDSGCANKLSWEIASYSATTGQIEAWVKVPTVSYSSDTIIYMCYDSTAVTAYQSVATSTWDSNYIAVYHFGNGTALSLVDSTSNGNNLTNNNTAATTGVIGGAITANGSSQYAYDNSPSNLPTGAAARTLSAWVKSGDTSQSASDLFGYGQNSWNGDRFAYTACGATCSGLETENYGAGWTNPASTSTWQYVAVTNPAGNSDLNSISAYANGASVSLSGSGSINTSSAQIALFGIPGALWAGEWNGNLDEVRISNIARSADWTATEFNNQNLPDKALGAGGFYTVGTTFAP